MNEVILSYSISFRFILWLIISVFVFLQFFINLPVDAKAMLSYSLEFERHGHFYDRAFDMNPPLIFLIHTITAFFINNFNIAPRVVFHLYNLFLCLLGYFTLLFSLTKASLPQREKALILDIYAFVIVVAPSFAINWGERDHLLFVFSLPWIIQILWQQKPTYLSAILAGIGFCIRPHNVVIPIFIMISQFLRERDIKKTIQESKILVIIFEYFLYIVTIFIYFPKYINIINVSILTYPSICILSYKLRILVTLIYLIFIYKILLKENKKYLYRIYTLSISFSIWFLFNQMWVYTKIALIIPFLMGLIFLILSNEGFLKKCFFITISLYFLYSHFHMISNDISSSKNENYLIVKSFFNGAFEENMPFKEDVINNAGKNFVLLSTNSWGSHFVRLGKTHHEYAFDWLWPLPWVYAHQTDTRALKIRSLMADYLVQALERDSAPTLLIDRSPVMRGLPVSSDERPAVFLEDFLAQNHESLKNALTKYTYIKTIDSCEKGKHYGFACRIDVFKSH